MKKKTFCRIYSRCAVAVLVAGMLMPMVVSCGTGTSKGGGAVESDTLVVDTVATIEKVEKEETPVKPVKESKKEDDKKVEPKQEAKPKAEEMPTEIGASPDAVYYLDDNETETTPKFADGEKALKKLIKEKLRKGQKGEKAKFRASIVIKKDGTVGRVQFTECGYSDEYKPEIIAALQSLPAFTPGTKDGKPVDSWYYLTWKR